MASNDLRNGNCIDHGDCITLIMVIAVIMVIALLSSMAIALRYNTYFYYYLQAVAQTVTVFIKGHGEYHTPSNLYKIVAGDIAYHWSYWCLWSFMLGIVGQVCFQTPSSKEAV